MPSNLRTTFSVAALTTISLVASRAYAGGGNDMNGWGGGQPPSPPSSTQPPSVQQGQTQQQQQTNAPKTTLTSNPQLNASPTQTANPTQTSTQTSSPVQTANPVQNGGGATVNQSDNYNWRMPANAVSVGSLPPGYLPSPAIFNPCTYVDAYVAPALAVGGSSTGGSGVISFRGKSTEIADSTGFLRDKKGNLIRGEDGKPMNCWVPYFNAEAQGQAAVASAQARTAKEIAETNGNTQRDIEIIRVGKPPERAVVLEERYPKSVDWVMSNKGKDFLELLKDQPAAAPVKPPVRRKAPLLPRRPARKLPQCLCQTPEPGKKN